MSSFWPLRTQLPRPKRQPPVNSVVRPLAEHSAPIATGLLSSTGAGHNNDLLRVTAVVNSNPALVLLDCGSTHSFVSSSWTRRHNSQSQSTDPIFVTMADGVRQSTCTTKAGPLSVTIGHCSFHHSFNVLDVEGYDFILGMPWFREHNPSIDFKTHRVCINGSAFIARASTSSVQSAALHFISGKQATKELRRGSQCYFARVEVMQDKEPVTSWSHFTKEHQQQMSDTLSQFQDCLPDNMPDGLPPKRDINHDIDIEPGSTPPSRPPFRLPKPELDELERQLQELLKLGYIQPSLHLVHPSSLLKRPTVH